MYVGMLASARRTAGIRLRNSFRYSVLLRIASFLVLTRPGRVKLCQAIRQLMSPRGMSFSPGDSLSTAAWMSSKFGRLVRHAKFGSLAVRGALVRHSTSDHEKRYIQMYSPS